MTCPSSSRFLPRRHALGVLPACVWIPSWASASISSLEEASHSFPEGFIPPEMYAVSSPGTLGGDPWSLLTWISLGGLAFLWSAAAFAWMQRRVRRLEIHQDQSARFSRQLIRSQEHERSRIAGELHDGLGHELQLIRNKVQIALNHSPNDPLLMAHLNAISQTALRAIEGVRALSKGLHPPELHHLGLTSALDRLATRVRESFAGSMEFHVDAVDGLLDRERELDVYRIAQEALGNALRHAAASDITFEVCRLPEAVQISIFDNGSGFDTRLLRDPQSTGSGLANMDQRAKWLGGRLELHSEPGTGTRVTLAVPLLKGTHAS